MRNAALVTVIAIQALSLFNYYTRRQWTNWTLVVPMDEIVAHVEQNAQAGDLVIFDEWNLYDGPFYYWHGGATVARFGLVEPRWPTQLSSAPRVWAVRAVRDNSPGQPMERLLLHIKRNFILKEQIGYVKEPPAIYQQKRRWLRREVFSHKIECLLFERPIEK